MHELEAVLAHALPTVEAPAEHLYHDPRGLDLVIDNLAHAAVYRSSIQGISTL